MPKHFYEDVSEILKSGEKEAPIPLMNINSPVVDVEAELMPLQKSFNPNRSPIKAQSLINVNTLLKEKKPALKNDDHAKKEVAIVSPLQNIKMNLKKNFSSS